MAITSEQQAEIDLQEARESGRRTHELALEARRARLEAVRLAKETLIENDRSKPVGDRGVTSSDILTFAQAIDNYIKQ